jgi:hypothetical protein
LAAVVRALGEFLLMAKSESHIRPRSCRQVCYTTDLIKE